MKALSTIRRAAHRQMRHYPVPWASIPLLSAQLARQHPMACPMILIISMPRSGSTWVGETLAQSPRAAYLHEPFTQTLLDETAQEGTFQFPIKTPPRSYRRVAAHLHRGLPQFRHGIVRYPDKWTLSSRGERRLVVKEVNLLGLPWFLKEFQPRVIHLVRHPAAVASHRTRLAAGHQSLYTMFLPETIERYQAQWIEDTGDPWVIAGAAHGLATHITSQLLANYPDAIEVTYEQLSRAPMQEFETLLDFCDLPLTPDMRQYIQASTGTSDCTSPQPWSSGSDHAMMNERWIHEFEPDHVTRLRKGFQSMEPNFYQDDAWWSLPAPALTSF